MALANAMRRDLVEARRWLSEGEYDDGLAIAAACPGPLAYQLGVYCGYIRHGVAGGLAAAVAFALAPSVLVTSVAWLLHPARRQLADPRPLLRHRARGRVVDPQGLLEPRAEDAAARLARHGCSSPSRAPSPLVVERELTVALPDRRRARRRALRAARCRPRREPATGGSPVTPAELGRPARPGACRRWSSGASPR